MKIKASDLKKIIKEELDNLLREGVAGKSYWIDPSGKKHEIEGLHIEWLARNSEKFPSIPDSFDTKNIMDPDYAQRRFIPKGWVNLAVFKGDTSVRGTERHIRDNINKIISDDPDMTYTVVVYNDQGEPVEEHLSMSLEDFMERFSGRSRGNSKSKVSKFR